MGAGCMYRSFAADLESLSDCSFLGCHHAYPRTACLALVLICCYLTLHALHVPTWRRWVLYISAEVWLRLSLSAITLLYLGRCCLPASALVPVRQTALRRLLGGLSPCVHCAAAVQPWSMLCT